MRKFCLFLALVMILALSACTAKDDDKSPIRVGMSRTEFSALPNYEKMFGYCGYVFFANENGESVVVEFSADRKQVARVETFPAVASMSEDGAQKIVPGMSVFDVVAIAGLPCRSATFGISSLDFHGDSADYRVEWDNDMKVIGCSAVAVN